ncbi:LamG-like jellyroll fold domain-containing protein [Blastopirellula marina]|uniref:Iron dicitrate transport regulator FecR n=1 Tax=Blastopirellula marina TaxID=124 RepID=A0A2S8FAS3_9BACT|nr:LamG-like jellyroll fold domain-containing protein [Blastopirellula marina]PQO29024.1 iron dicitrate transport regulator FecR [Blastopirellula marina]PTL42296.1 iron dicitrate transport regulator FecR [Blastopirellula marina]
MNDPFSELDSLLLGWETDTLSAAELQRLQSLLKEDAAAREHFLRWQMLTAALDLESHAAPLSQQERATDNLAKLPDRTQRSPLATLAAFSLAASILIAAWLAWALFSGDANPNDGQPAITAKASGEEVTSQGVAILTRLVEPVWAKGASSRQVGEALGVGRFQLESGLAQIEFFCGATVVVEGPADLQLESAKHARVRQGRIRANVPPAARGFSLEADKLKVVDLGTEFGLAVSPDAVDVQVFDGEVELYPQSKESRRIVGGQAVSVANSGTLTDSPLQPERFVGISELESLGDQQDALRYERWKKWSEAIGGDSRLVTLYAFDRLSDWERRLPCGKRPIDRDLDGAIIGAKVVPGRWTAKSALEFKQPADRVRVQIPGNFQSLTFSCWTRIDSLDRMFNSLFLTDSYDLGEPHWQILESGQLYFSVRPVPRAVNAGPKDFKALSPKFWNPTLQGKWIHLAVAFDWDSRTIVHYLNGSELSRHLVPAEQMPPAVQIGAASIGNWELPTNPDAKFAVRNLNGRIDEFMIFSSALSSDEIRDIYENGKP